MSELNAEARRRLLAEAEGLTRWSGPWRSMRVVSEMAGKGRVVSAADACIRYGDFESPFGSGTVAWGEQGICALSFDSASGVECPEELLSDWPGTRFYSDPKVARDLGKKIFSSKSATADAIKIHMRGTPFQLQVWEALIRVPAGKVVSYSQLAAAIGQPGASRAVGSAVAQNRIGWLVPCHRVIRKDGTCGEFRWGRERKQMMLDLEAGGTRA